MAPTRPSRQQLQLSASPSDAVNWAEFSNTQVQFDDDNIIYPPFRHRGLPSPPPQCHHPSCEPKWNCSACSSCHPLMRMTASTNNCTHGYTAVYETIDDDEDDPTFTGQRVLPTLPPQYQGNPPRYQRNPPQYQQGNPPQYQPNGVLQSLDPIRMDPHSCHTVSNRQNTSTPPNDLSRPDARQEVETGFNGDEATIKWPKYFELDHNCDTMANRNLTMKSFQSPYQEKWGLNPSLAQTTFGKNPPLSPLTSTQMAPCNQLCATCVPNIISMTPCTSSSASRQNGYIPNGKVVNINPPYPQKAMRVSNVENNHHVYNNSSLLPNRNIVESSNQRGGEMGIGVGDVDTLSGYSNVNLNLGLNQTLTDDQISCKNHPPCDFSHQRTRTDQPHSVCQVPVRKRLSQDMARFESAMMERTTPSPNGDLHNHDSSSINSPSRHWCPTCQQVPLLENRNDAFVDENNGSARASARNSRTSWEINDENQQNTNSQLGFDGRSTNGTPCMDSESNTEEVSTAEMLLNPKDLSVPSHNTLDMRPMSWLEELSHDPLTSSDIDHTRTDSSVNPEINSEACPRVTSLHSTYFKNTSKA